MNYGLFINSIVSFLIVAFAVFLHGAGGEPAQPGGGGRGAEHQGLSLLPHGRFRSARPACPQCTSELR